MAWSRELPLAPVLVRVLQLQMRAERLLLAQKIRAAEAQAHSLGLPASDLRAARHALALQAHTDEPDKLLTLDAATPDIPEPLKNIEIKA